ncbi:hypothetical protein Hypma_011058 [Hypsizygus marmoreus]|uniref:Uncharacterized protein n=1 Tax=Hypsizygus marmoreus TaxID=39966 RepID=A0A369JN23_HYPMA|nr:hypothetical protein Hypma_011058 [Hypsizygus marmoreus]
MQGAGSPSASEIFATLFDDSVGDAVHPLLLEAVVQHVLSLPSDPPVTSRPPFRNINAPAPTAPGVGSSIQNANPYWHLTQMPAQSPFPPSQNSMFPPSSYDAFWSFVGQQQTVPVTSVLPPHNYSIPGLSRTTNPSPALEKARADLLSNLATEYPTLAGRIRVFDGKDSTFECKICHHIIPGNRNAIRHHIIGVHNLFTASVQTCIAMGCEAPMLVSSMIEHIADDHCFAGHAVCGLCNKDFTQSSYAFRHLKDKKCNVLRQADRYRVSNGL